MPRKDIDYSKCVIHKIVCNDLNIKELYVGSTTDFVKRKATHKSRCSKENNDCFNFKIYKIIRDNGGWDNWSLYVIEKFPCNDSYDARARERYWIEILNSNLNTILPNRTIKEYHETNKDKIKEYSKKYYENNKDKIQEYYEKQKENCNDYYSRNKDKLKAKKKEYYEKQKENCNDYYSRNKDKIKERKKEYYEKNKEKILEKCKLRYESKKNKE